MKRHETAAGLLLLCVLGLLIGRAPTRADEAVPQAAAAVGTCEPGRDLIAVPEIKSERGILRAELALLSGKRTLWGSVGDSRCLPQDLRFFAGRSLLNGESQDPAFTSGEPIPGPTLRARVGDLIEVKFVNRIDTQAFSSTLDQENVSSTNTTGCDEVRSDAGLIYPNQGPGGDMMPNCLHGSSTANIHFHGTHTTPATTGDNVLLFVRPALRGGTNRAAVQPSDQFIDRQFKQIWTACEKDGPPDQWQDLPQAWRNDQERLLKQYDRTAPYQGQPGKLPHDMQLWPVNQQELTTGLWPQYQIGAYPYCFRVPEYKEAAGRHEGTRMGQAPGTHWYHAHKHGSTALNVANGMTGAFVIEGPYDDDLRRFYGAAFRDQVLVLQQLSSNPFPVLNPGVRGPNSVAKPQFSVNGRLSPVVKMRPGEVQLWRFVNAAYRSAIQLQSFGPQAGMAWRQIAQDGVQFTFENYDTLGAANLALNLAPANRADFLVKAPAQAGRYTLTALPNEGLVLDKSFGNPPRRPFQPESTIPLLTVSVDGTPVSPAQDFIKDRTDFPRFPTFLADIPAKEITTRREIVFGPVHNLIDGKSFDPNKFNQVMVVNTAEEWKISNQANDKAHPFHIHVNPFQIVEVFQPNLENTTDPNQPCYVNPMQPDTWKPCKGFGGPFVWWDTFAVPTSTQITLAANVCTILGQCPPQIQPYTTCATQNGVSSCRLTIPGYFKMRTRFVDFTGAYVIHCHILIHEDRGMMQMVEVVPERNPYTHR